MSSITPSNTSSTNTAQEEENHNVSKEEPEELVVQGYCVVMASAITNKGAEHLINKLNKEGSYTVPADLLEKIQAEFTAYYCDDARAEEIMGRVYKEKGYLCDPHTASGWAAAEDYVKETGDNRAMVVLSTASPYKFPVAVLTAIGGDTSGTEFEQMARLSALTSVPVPKNLANLEGKEEKHTGVIEKDAMLEYVLSL